MEQIQKNMYTPDTFMQGVKDCIPTLLGYISIGVAFGVVGIASGISVLEIFLLSVLVYAGSAQFIFCGLYVAGPRNSGDRHDFYCQFASLTDVVNDCAIFYKVFYLSKYRFWHIINR